MNSGSPKGNNSYSLQVGVNKEIKMISGRGWNLKGKYWELLYGSKYGYYQNGIISAPKMRI